MRRMVEYSVRASLVGLADYRGECISLDDNNNKQGHQRLSRRNSGSMVKRTSEALGQGFVWTEQGDEAWNLVGRRKVDG